MPYDREDVVGGLLFHILMSVRFRHDLNRYHEFMTGSQMIMIMSTCQKKVPKDLIKYKSEHADLVSVQVFVLNRV